jgi:hypothetical protein
MKKLYVLMASALCVLGAQAAGLQHTFGSENSCWTVGNDAAVTYTAGHMAVEMPGTDGKYRADISYKKGDTDGYTIDASSNKILAIKFIGTRPQGNMTLEMDNNGSWLKNSDGKDAWKNSPQGSVVTTSGNTIYYYDLTRSPEYTGDVVVTKLNIKLADNTDEPHSYVVDWISTYASVEALEADKDWKDDGDNDADEANVKAAPVVNETTGTGYTALADAISAALDGDVLTINEDQTVTSRIGVGDRHVTLKAGAEGVQILRGEKFSNSLMFLINNGTDAAGNKVTGTLTFVGLIINGQNVEASTAFFEASNGGTVEFQNVTFRNCVTTHNQGLVAMKSSGHVNVENVIAENCSVIEGRGQFFCGTNSLSVSGDNSISVYLEGTYSVAAANLSGSHVIDLYCDPARDLDAGAIAVRGTEDVAFFHSGMNGVNLKADNGNVVWYSDPTYSEITVAEADANVLAPVYYNLQGVRVANPAHGLYIVVRGNKAVKEYVK